MRDVKKIAITYGAFCIVNLAVGYFYSRQQNGPNFVTDLNSSLLRFNILSYFLPE